MKEVKEKKDVHHGRNIRLARAFKNYSQENLAFDLGVDQSEISRLEKQQQITDEMLDRIAKALDVTPEFLKNFMPDEATKTLNINAENSPNVSIENSTETESNVVKEENNDIDYDIENETIYYYSPELLQEVKSLYERLLAEKDKEIEFLRKQVK